MRTITMIAILVLTSAFASPRNTLPQSRASLHASQSGHVRVGRFEVRDRPVLLAQAVSNRCVTPSVTCLLAQAVAVGTPCWCATTEGPVNGVVR